MVLLTLSQFLLNCLNTRVHAHTCTHTHTAGMQQATPTEKLPVRGERWEEGVSDLVTGVLQPLGFSLLSVSKLPYLCEGDLHNDWFILQDIILVLSKDSATSQ